MSNTTLVDKINNNGVYADRAVNDKNGFDITETYAPRKSLAKIAFTGDYSDLVSAPSVNPHLEITNSIEPTNEYDWARINVRLKKQYGTGANLSGLLINMAGFVEASGANITAPNGSTDVFYFADGLTSPLTYTNKTLYFYVDSPLRLDDGVRLMVVNESSLANVTSSSKFLLCSDSTWSSNFKMDGGLGEWVENWNNYYSSGFDWAQPFLLVVLRSDCPSQAYDSPDYYISQYGTSVFYNNGSAAIQDHEQAVSSPGMSVDTSVIATKSDLSSKQNTLTAGTNVTITNNTISATDTTYSAGNGLSLSNGAFAIDSTVVATQSDLAPYATTSAMETALAGKQNVLTTGDGIAIDANNEISVDTTVIATKTDLASKQDTISDLSAIRSGASLGSTAVQPATLDDYATTSALTSGLAEKQDTISDLSTIRTGASAGATAVQPGDLATVAISGSYSDLTNKPTIPTVPDTKPVVAGSNITITEGTNDITISATDTTYSAGTGISISSGTISNSDPLPSHTSTESGKVLGVDSNGDLDWVASSSATVDQTYNASSTNAQSGTAVAQAIASIPSASYTAGDGIDITSGEISVAYNQNTLDVAAISTTASISSVMAGVTNFYLPSDVSSMISSLMTDGQSVTMTIPSGILTAVRDPGLDVFLMFSADAFPVVNNSVILKATLAHSGRSLDGQTVTLPVVDSTNWYIGSNVTTPSQFGVMSIGFGSGDGSSVSIGGDAFYSESSTLDPPLTFSQLGAPQLTVLDPIPSHSSGDSGKVLTVNSSGNAAWATPSVVPTAGNMLSTTNNVLNVTTTAGITDIQQVNALPAQPVATVLYLIPET